MAMLIGQLSGRKSLRDRVENLHAQQSSLYHLGMKSTSRATLARVNEKQPAALYQDVYFYLLNKYTHTAPQHKFSFENKVYLLDATSIDLCLSAFPWAEYRQKKRAIKLHIGLDDEGYLPTFLNMSNGKISDIEKVRPFQFPQGAFVVFDRGYTDYDWYEKLTQNGVFFVTRLKKNADVEYLRKLPGRRSTGISNDQLIERLGTYADGLVKRRQNGLVLF